MYNKTALEIHNLFLEKKLSATEITKYFLKRIEKYDKKINAFINVLNSRALKKAKNLDLKIQQNKPVGRLAGIPVTIKDNIHIKEEKTTCASKFLENYIAPFNATVVSLLENEDAIILGKTNLDEFAMGSSCEYSSFFPTKNPWNLKWVSGGSSGGSCASVSCRTSLISLGSDTGGSIRLPAAFCSVVGFKPTYGRISRYGLTAFASSLDQIGPIATNAKDIALIMQIIGMHCEKDSTCLNFPQETYLEKMPKSLKNIKIGIPYHFLENLSSDISKNFKNVINIFKDLGAEIIDIQLDILKYSIAVYQILVAAEASTNLARFDGIKYGYRSKEAKTLADIYQLSREEGFGSEVKRRIMLGTYVLSSGYQDEYYKKAQRVRTLIIQAFDEAFSKCDFVSMPTMISPCFELKAILDPIKMYQQDLLTISANLAGLPAISIPSGFDMNKKPLAFQLHAPMLQDVKLIQYANVLDEKLENRKKIPPLFDKE